jgi:uncharacterized protein (TIGR01777 family)
VLEVQWTPNGGVDVWARVLEEADAVVNLSGADIAGARWTTARKALLRDSRLRPTQSLVRASETTRRRPSVFVQGSAVGYYGASLDDTPLAETAAPGEDFLGRLCVEWEAAAAPIADMGVRLVTVRTGIALARRGGALPLMALPFHVFAGGPLGLGRQSFSWIHRQDWAAMVAWIIGRPDIDGPINATAPDPVTNAEFAAALSRALDRPAWFRVPAFALRLAVGREMADMALLNGQCVVPARAMAEGFPFTYPRIDDALAKIYRG